MILSPYGKRLAWAALIIVLLGPRLYSQEKDKIVPNGTEGIIDTVDAATGKIKDPKANDFDGSMTTFRIGFGYILDFSSYSESPEFKEQMAIAGIDLVPKFKTRDFRILGSGILKTKRAISCPGMYRRIHVSKCPFVCGQLAVGVHIHFVR